MLQKIRVKSRKGKIYTRTAWVTEWISLYGKRFTDANNNAFRFEVIEQDFYGNIYKATKR